MERISVDRPFAEQTTTQDLLNSLKSEPISETVLNQALRLAESAIQSELETQKRTHVKLTGLYVSWSIVLESNNQTEREYTLGWGKTFQPSERSLQNFSDLPPGENSQEDATIADDNAVSPEFLELLNQRIEEFLKENLTYSLSAGKKLHVQLNVSFVSELKILVPETTANIHLDNSGELKTRSFFRRYALSQSCTTCPNGSHPGNYTRLVTYRSDGTHACGRRCS